MSNLKRRFTLVIDWLRSIVLCLSSFYMFILFFTRLRKCLKIRREKETCKTEHVCKSVLIFRVSIWVLQISGYQATQFVTSSRKRSIFPKLFGFETRTRQERCKEKTFLLAFIVKALNHYQ